MNKKNVFAVFLTLVAILLVYRVYVFSINYWGGDSYEPIDMSYMNISYTIGSQKIKLIDGTSEISIAPNSASPLITTLLSSELIKDINNDNQEDRLVFLTQQTGGSGTFYYVAGVLKNKSAYIATHALLIGDRITPQSIESGPGESIIVNYLDRAPGEPMSTSPSIKKSIQLILDPETLQFGEVAQNFEGEADPQRMELGMKTWKWIQVEYSDGKVIKPSKDTFSITFKNNGAFDASTDCNGVGGRYTTTKSSLAFSDIMSTLMYCDGSQESDFKKILENTQSYFFTSKGELVLNLKHDSGSVYFK